MAKIAQSSTIELLKTIQDVYNCARGCSSLPNKLKRPAFEQVLDICGMYFWISKWIERNVKGLDPTFTQDISRRLHEVFLKHLNN